ncbi:hypothetical protein [Alterisphingorhabdus coralli]|uniref:Uncharacterized protein n=1 Tax=Alterisphingorhabdus coralli TaxID=3071408 RepID=A0AA97I103_9SPHN|nr:hypothetical protein [Parasphingorhabdus sp. SCSIO 66989]WOE74760.1 hypothetical protein RB602_13055 [Parasphingorhabdus sp. SCSIO 66989]
MKQPPTICDDCDNAASDANRISAFWRFFLAPVFLLMPLPITHAARSEDSRETVKATSKVRIRHGIRASQASEAALQAKGKTERDARQLSKRRCPEGNATGQGGAKDDQKSKQVGRSDRCTLVVIENY